MKNNDIKEKKLLIIGNIAFIMSLISPMLSFALATTVGEVEIFGVAGIVRYSWIMLLFIPFGIISFIMGGLLKKSNKKYLKNQIVAYVTIPFLLVMGSYRFIYASINDYSPSLLSQIEQDVNINLPDNVKIATTLREEEQAESYVKIIDSQEKLDFEVYIDTNPEWVRKMPSTLQNALPYEIEVQLINFEYFMFFNYTTEEFNLYPQCSGDHDYLFIAYDIDLGRLIILNHYNLSVIN